MEWYAWLVGESSQAEDTDFIDLSPSRKPPEFLSSQKTKPSRLPQAGEKWSCETDPLTPLESRLKDIVVSVYSDRKRLPKSTPPLGDKPEPITTAASASTLPSNLSSRKGGVTRLALDRPNPDGSESLDVPTPDKGIRPEISTKTQHRVSRYSPEGEREGGQFKSELEKGRCVDQSAHPTHNSITHSHLNRTMSDKRSTSSTADLASSSAPIFSANDRNIELSDPDFPPVAPLGSLPYSDTDAGSYHGEQLLGAEPIIPGDRSHLVSLDFLNSSPSLLYSFTDPTADSAPAAKRNTRSGIVDSFSVDSSSLLYRPKPAKLRQLRSSDSGSRHDHGNGSIPHTVPTEVKGESKETTPTPESILDAGRASNLPSPPHPRENLQSQGTMTLPGYGGEIDSVDSSGDPDHLPVMASLESDMETASVVSVQQLTETYLTDPLDVVATPLSEGGKFPFTFPATTAGSPQVQSESPTGFPPNQLAKEPLRPQEKLSQHIESGRIPAHFKPSVSRGDFSPYSGEVPKPVDTARSSNPTPTNDLSETDGSSELKILEDKLEEEQKVRTFLEGQLEAVKEECDAALRDRPKILSQLSRAEAELAEKTAALEKERTKHRMSSQPPVDDASSAKQAVKDLKDAKEALAAEKKAVNDLKGQLNEEEHKSRRLEKNLEDAKQSLKDQETDISDLRDKCQKSHMEMAKKASQVEEMAGKLSASEASYGALEQNKAWLHDQLQEAQRAKVKLQEELRESKAYGIAHDIKCDQLQKENVAHQKQIADLLQGVLLDKAKMVSQLETIEEDVLSHESLCAKLIAEKTQLESAVSQKEEALSQLNSTTARDHVEREELKQKADEARCEHDKLSRKMDDLERENASLLHKLASSARDLEEKESDLSELEKIKTALQNKLRHTDAETMTKEGSIQTLKDANDLLQQELALVNDAKTGLETESAESKRELAILEAELKSALDKCKERDSQMRGVLESQHSADDQKQALCALLTEKDKELEQKDEAIKAMEVQMNEVLRDFGALQNNFRSIASESGSVTNSIAEKDRVISHLSSEKDVRDEKLCSLERENEGIRDALAQLQHEKAHLLGQVEGSVNQGEYKKVLQDKAQLQDELSTLKVGQKRDEIKAQAKINRLETDLKASQKAGSKTLKELQSLKEENEELLRKTDETRHLLEADIRDVREKLQRALDDKERSESLLSSLKPSEQKIQQVLRSKCEQLKAQNEELIEQVHQVTQQKADIERASGLVATKLKQNAEREKRELVEKNRGTLLELERLRGRLTGLQATQVTVRDHATSLEVALAKKESSIVRLSAESQKVLEEKQQEDAMFKTQIDALEKQLMDLNADIAFHQEKAEDERRKAEELERELRKHVSDSASDQSKQSAVDPDVVSNLNNRVASLSLEKDALQSDLSYLKSQLLIAKTSAESAKRQVADRASQVEILERDLRIAEARCQEAEEEVRQLQDHLKAGDVSHEVELEQLRRSGAGEVGGGVDEADHGNYVMYVV